MKTIRIPFDLEKAKAGAKVVTDDGNSVKILEYNKRLQNSDETIMVALVDMGSYDDVCHFRHDGLGFPHTLFIEEEIKTRRMTIKELAWWLRDHPEEHREFKYKDTQKVDSHGSYNECDQNEECNQNIVVRRNGGEWEEPLIEN